MEKLNELAKVNKIRAFGFKSFSDFAEKSNQSGQEVVVSTLSPAIMADKGISVYYAPVIPRNSVFATSQNIMDADLDINSVTVLRSPSWDMCKTDRVAIVSRHPGTIDILKEMYPDAPVLPAVSCPNDLNGRDIIGTLPPHLVAACRSYRAVTIKDFDYAKDGDIHGEELKQRICISAPITVNIQ